MQLKTAVRTVLVVVADVADEHSSEVALVRDDETAGALGSHGSHPALGEGVRVGRTHGSPHDACSSCHTASKLEPNFPSRSRRRYMTERPALRRSSVTLRAHWVTHSQVGFFVTPATVATTSRAPPTRIQLASLRRIRGVRVPTRVNCSRFAPICCLNACDQSDPPATTRITAPTADEMATARRGCRSARCLVERIARLMPSGNDRSKPKTRIDMPTLRRQFFNIIC